MKKFTFFLLLFFATFNFAQVHVLTAFNAASINQSIPDSLRPYFESDRGIRSVCVAPDMDNDGKYEYLVTDYSNRGRVHVMEVNSSGDLEIVWSSPLNAQGGGSTPRWVRTGDLDGDGKGEIIFPNSLNSSTDIRVRVFEWDGSGDNSYVEVSNMPKDVFASQGVGNFRTNRETAEVYDFDGDGRDELIMSNRDNRVYVIGVSNSGFGGWQLEGGSPALVPKIGAGSHWHSVPADINGDGDIEIINHYWNFYGFYSINPTGANTYMYPDTAQVNEWIEFMYPDDAVAYLGIKPVDVDGDGKDEIAGIAYSSNYDVTLVSIPQGGDELYSWQPGNFGVVGTNLWELGGDATGDVWGIGAADLNANGRTEILAGGTNGYTVTAVEYSGAGSLLNEASYEKRLVFKGIEPYIFKYVNIYKNGVQIDTIFTEGPFVSRMFSSFDSNGDGRQEVALTFQIVPDSIHYKYYTFNSSSGQYILDSAVAQFNLRQISLLVLEADYAIPVELVSFTASSVDDGVSLEWSTATEKNNFGFYIERKTTGEWSAVDFIKGAGTSTETHDYKYIDKHQNLLGISSVYYRIKQVDFDGSVQYSNIESINLSPYQFVLERNYPNPFNPSTKIRYAVPSKTFVTLKVFDILGKEVKSLVNEAKEPGYYEVEFDGSKLSSGVYL